MPANILGDIQRSRQLEGNLTVLSDRSWLFSPLPFHLPSPSRGVSLFRLLDFEKALSSLLLSKEVEEEIDSEMRITGSRLQGLSIIDSRKTNKSFLRKGGQALPTSGSSLGNPRIEKQSSF